MNLQPYLAELTSGKDERAEAAAQEFARMAQNDAQQVIAALQSIIQIQAQTSEVSETSEVYKLLEAPEIDQRWWALRALAEIEHPQTAPLLAQALSDSEPAVRQCAALGLRIIQRCAPNLKQSPPKPTTKS